MPLSSQVFPREPGDYVAAVTDATVHAVDADFQITRGIYVGATGNLQVVMADGATVTFTGVLAGHTYPIRITGTRAAGTTSTNIVRLY